jgi:hypothetical protein
MVGTSDTETLGRDLAEERARMGETIDAIQRRLSRGQLVDEVLRHRRGAGSDVVASLGRTLSANPVPTALLGLGLLWLLLAPPVTTKTRPRDVAPAEEAASWQI